MTAQLDTNFNRAPYHNDYDADKNFHAVLFKPGIPVQTRELNQLQTLLQEQVTRFGDNILKEGTIIRGCGFSYINKYAYVKILDLQTDGQPVNASMFKSMKLEGMTTGVTAVVEETIDGLQSQIPDLNTLYVKYTSSGTNNEKVFSSTENIRITNAVTGLEVSVVTVAGLIDPQAVGNGYGVIVRDGIIYQKGYFVRVDAQSIVVSKYTDQPDGLKVGFDLEETIADVFSDDTLYDNALGSKNANAPGADRLVLTPRLVVMTYEQAAASDHFFALIEYKEGNPVKTRFRTEYNIIGDEMATRTYDESGNYVVERFNISVQEHRTAPDDFMTVAVSPGKAYIHGYYVDVTSPLKIDLAQSKDTGTINSQDIATNFGQYLLVKEFMGDFSFVGGTTVQLRSAAAGAVTGAGIPGTAPGTLIGTATVRSVEYDSGIAGTAAAQYKVFLYNVNMESGQNFADTRSLFVAGTAAADIVTTGTAGAIWKDFELRTPIFQLGKNGIKSLTNSEYAYRHRMTGTLATNGTMTLTLSGDTFAYGVGTLTSEQKRDIVLICNATTGSYTKGVPIDLAGATISASGVGGTLNISGLANPSAAMAVIVYVTAKRLNARPAQKLTKEVYVKINPSALSGGIGTMQYQLGLPDAQEIIGAWMGTTYSESEVDVTAQFTLTGGQTDTHYGLSTVTRSSALNVVSASRILLKLRVFQKDATIGNGFFTADSYIDVTPKQIPNFRGIDLRNAIDFRPWPTPTASYAIVIASATENPTGVLSFSDVGMLPPRTGNFFETDYEFYLSRQDRLVVTWDGAFRMIRGVASESPSLPAEPNRSMTLATFFVPPYQALSNTQAIRFQKTNQAIRFQLTNNRVYQMSHIAGLDRRLKQLEYYTVLSALEKDTSDMVIQDADGLDRFKSGILVDPFNDLNVSDLVNPEFRAGIDPSASELTPAFHTVSVPLKVHSTSGATIAGDLVMRPFTPVVYTEQPNATRYRNCVQNYWMFDGTSYVTPEYDDGVDYTRAPDINFTVDTTESMASLVEAINEFVPLRTVATTSKTQTSAVRTSTGTSQGGGTNTTTTTTNKTTTDIIKELTSQVSETHEAIGDFVTDVQFSPFMRSRELKIYITGLRPLTRHFVFFDGVDVTAHCAPAVVAVESEGLVNGLRKSDVDGASLVSDDIGTLTYIFTIPAATFFAGDRDLITVDVDDENSLDTATSASKFVYRAFNFSIEKSGLTMSTKQPQFVTTLDTIVTNTTTVNTVTVTRAPVRQGGGGDGGGNRGGRGPTDPLAQTIYMDPDFAPNNENVFLTGVDVFFKSKSQTFNLAAMVREVENGQPTKTIVADGLKILKPSDITTSDDSSAVTHIAFNPPVSLALGREYALVLKPDGNCPDFQVFTSVAGQKDLISLRSVTNDWTGGMLLSSTNDSTWTSYQNEDMKIVAYIARFPTGQGTATLVPNNMEFFELNATTGRFEVGERIYRQSANLAGTVSAPNVGGKQLVGSGTSFLSAYVPGDSIVIPMVSGVQIFEVASVTNNTNLTTVEPIPLAVSGRPHYKTLVGRVTHARYQEPIELDIEESSAKTSLVFQAGDVLSGLSSGASASIASVKSKLISFLQPHIYRVADTVNDITMGVSLTADAGAYSKNADFGANVYADRHNTVVRSRSTEIANLAGEYTTKLDVHLVNSQQYSSPVVNHKISATDVITFQINDDSSNETGNNGSAKTRYVSRMVQLADEVGAKDIKVYLTAFKPSGTNVDVYVKFKHQSDPADFEDKSWTKLVLDPSKDAFSSAADRGDFREIPYVMPLTAAEPTSAYSDGNDFGYEDSNGTLYDGFKFFAVKIVMTTSNNALVPRLKDMRAIALAG